jgi:hypothetical protein
MMKIHELIGTASLALLLSGCSPHPGAGTWLAEGEKSEFVELNVTYEGRTDIFDRRADDGSGAPRTAVRRCFWHGVDASVIDLSCVQAVNTDIEESYQLRVAPDNKTAELIKDSHVVGRYIRLAN